MRWISCAMTEAAILTGSKCETRRLGWENLKVGERLLVVRKGRGRKLGEDPGRLAVIRVSWTRRESLDMMLGDRSSTAREGMPCVSPRQFVRAFCKMNGCKLQTPVTLIHFTYERWFHGIKWKIGDECRTYMCEQPQRLFKCVVTGRSENGIVAVRGVNGWPRRFTTSDVRCCRCSAPEERNRFEDLVREMKESEE